MIGFTVIRFLFIRPLLGRIYRGFMEFQKKGKKLKKKTENKSSNRFICANNIPKQKCEDFEVRFCCSYDSEKDIKDTTDNFDQDLQDLYKSELQNLTESNLRKLNNK